MMLINPINIYAQYELKSTKNKGVTDISLLVAMVTELP